MSKNKKEELSVIYNGIKIIYGLGGLHACIKPGIYESTSDKIIKDIDVAAYYPSIADKYELFPHHLTKSYVDVLRDNIAERNKYPKGTSINLGLKLANNGTYGASKDKYSPIYDSSYTFSVTINGQLMLLKLIENLYKSLKDMTIIQINTDGITCIINRSDEIIFNSICKDWELWSKMVLEFAVYNKMWIRDVNNYIALSDKGKIKYKGAYEIDKEIHKNQGMKIVHIAVANKLIHNISIQETIRNCTDILQFCKRLKIAGGWNGEYHYIDRFEKKIKYLSKNTRYFISENGGALYKRKISDVKLAEEDKRNMLYIQGVLFEEDEDETKKKQQFIGVDTGNTVTLFNQRFNVPMKDYRIKYNYYIGEANKLVNNIYDGQLIM